MMGYLMVMGLILVGAGCRTENTVEPVPTIPEDPDLPQVEFLGSFATSLETDPATALTQFETQTEVARTIVALDAEDRTKFADAIRSASPIGSDGSRTYYRTQIVSLDDDDVSTDWEFSVVDTPLGPKFSTAVSE